MKNYEQPAIELIKFSVMDVLDTNSSNSWVAPGSGVTPETPNDWDV